MHKSVIGLLLLLAALSFAIPGAAAMSLFGPQTFSASDNGKTVTVGSGETFWISLPENPSTGYAWDLKLSEGLVKLSDKYEPSDRSGLLVGVGGTHSYEIKAMKNGSRLVNGTYRQAGNQSSEGMETYTLNVNVVQGNPLSGILRFAFPMMSGGIQELRESLNSQLKMLLKPDDNIGIVPTITAAPTPSNSSLPIVRNGGTPEPSLPAASYPAMPQEIYLNYKDVPPADSTSAAVGDTINLSLPENPSTGYSWLMTVSDGIEAVNDTYVAGLTGLPLRPIVGATGTHVWYYKVTKPGTQTITGVYKRPWESSSEDEKSYVLNVIAT